MAWNIEDVLFKLSQHRRPTSSSKRVLEESAQYADILLAQQLWTTDLAADPATAVAEGVAALDTDLVLTADPTTPTGEENSIWLAGNTDYIPRNIVPGDLGYTTTIKDNAGTIIPDGKLDEFGVLFLHKAGVLLVQDPTGFAAEYTFPPKLTAYRYIGGTNVPAGQVDGGSYLDTYAGVAPIDGGGYT